MESRNAKPGLTFNMNIICGYHSDLAALEVNVMPNPLELTLLSFKDLVIPLQTRVPIKRHFLFYDTREHRGVYDSAIFSFLSATSAITLVDHARSLKLNDLKYPAHLKPSISITEACPSDSFGGISETKLLYRNDLVKIVSCLQNDLMLDSLIGSELLEGRVTLDVFLVKSTKFDEKVP